MDIMNRNIFLTLGLLATTALSLSAESLSYTGTLGSPEDVFEVSFTLSSTSTVTVQTWSFGGGVNAMGQPIAAGGFDPLIALFSGTGPSATIVTDTSGNPLIDADNLNNPPWAFVGNCPPAGVVAIGFNNDCGDDWMQVTLAAGTYTLLLSDANYIPAAINDNGSLSEGFTDLTAGVFQTCDPAADACITPNGNYAVDITSPGLVNHAAQTITFPAIPTQYALTSVGLSATASSGLTVVFTSLTPSVCSVSGAMASSLAYGSCTIQATQPGNSNYKAAPAVNQSFWINHAAQTITFPPVATQTAGTSVTLTATASSGLTVSYTSTTPTVCSVSGATASSLISGTCIIQATQAGNGAYGAATPVSNSFWVNHAAQTITFPNPGAQVALTSVGLTATASSGLTVSYTSTTPTICSVAGATASTLTIGTCTIQATQAGNGAYTPAPAVNQSFMVTGVAQTITFPAIASPQVAATSVGLTATASSGLAVSYTSTTPTICSVSGATASSLISGSCTIRATQTGNGAYSAAPAVNQSYWVNHATQTITFPAIPTPQVAVTSVGLTATASSGLAVTFTSTTPTICSVSGATASTLISGTCTIQATQAGNGAYSAAPAVNQSFWVGHATQTITFPAIATPQIALTGVNLTATASSGLAVSYISTTPTYCTVSGSTAMPILASGTCTIEATQAGNTLYSAAPAISRSFWVNHATQTITFPAIATQVALASVGLTATATSGLAVTYTSATPTVCSVSGTTASTLISGTCTIQATQPGNAVYAAAPAVNKSFTVTHAVQTITFPAIPTPQVALTSVGLTATASSGLTVTYTSATPTICSVSGATASTLLSGTCTIQATQTGNGAYGAAPAVNQSFWVNHATQTITFPNPGPQSGVPSLSLTANASSGLTVSFASTTPTVCTVAAGGATTASLLINGTCTIQATQAGGGAYGPAPAVNQSFTVTAP
jgi:hypothetical protein